MTPLFREMDRISQRFTTALRGITVVKTVWANDEGLSVVRFEIDSAREDAVRLRMVESVPDSFPMENVGPHPKYGGDKWTKTDDGEFVYTDRLEPNGEKFTLYGVKELSSNNLESFLTDAQVTIDPLGDEPIDDSGDESTMTTEDTENDGLDDDGTDDDADFTRGGGSTEELTRGGSREDFTRGGGGNFDDRIPRVEDLGTVSGGWGTDQSGQGNDPSNIQFVGSKAHASESSQTDESRPPIELEEPTETFDSDAPESEGDDADAVESEGDDADAVETEGDDDGVESDSVDSPELVEESDTTDTGTDDTSAEDADDDAEAVEDADAEAEAVEDESTLEDEASNTTDESQESESEVTSGDESLFEDAHEVDGDDSLVDALVTELAARDLSDDERAVLREALGVSAPTSVDVRLRHVQNRVDDLDAYTTALESFLDENGTAEQVLDDLQTETEAMRDDIERLESTLAASKEAIELVEQQVTAIEDRMVDEATFEERLGELDEKLVSESEFEAQLDDLSTDLTEIRADVETGKTWRSNLSQAIQLPSAMMDADGSDGSESDEQEL
ncbi:MULTISPECIES: hypothetical protein [Haloferax]|uniref:Uncharacterized protein n=1 Tax=Haloferax marinum TaxID=2666143 RepID=A0A6A8GAM2_9EURY|nr:MULTISPECIES: hypothetical protein [Haloferax]MRW98051.1 hypothetical protein [Haloferax marinum]